MSSLERLAQQTNYPLKNKTRTRVGKEEGESVPPFNIILEACGRPLSALSSHSGVSEYCHGVKPDKNTGRHIELECG